MQGQSQLGNFQTVKPENKFPQGNQFDSNKAYLQYIADLQELLFAKVEELEQFKDATKAKLKGLSFLLVEKGLSTEELFQVINSNKPVKTAIELSEQDEEETMKEDKDQAEERGLENNSSNNHNNLSSTVFIEGNGPINKDNNHNTQQSFNTSLISKYKDIRNKRDVKHFLKRKRKEYQVDSAQLKEVIQTNRKDIHVNNSNSTNTPLTNPGHYHTNGHTNPSLVAMNHSSYINNRNGEVHGKTHFITNQGNLPNNGYPIYSTSNNNRTMNSLELKENQMYRKGSK